MINLCSRRYFIFSPLLIRPDFCLFCLYLTCIFSFIKRIPSVDFFCSPFELWCHSGIELELKSHMSSNYNSRVTLTSVLIAPDKSLYSLAGKTLLFFFVVLPAFFSINRGPFYCYFVGTGFLWIINYKSNYKSQCISASSCQRVNKTAASEIWDTIKKPSHQHSGRKKSNCVFSVLIFCTNFTPRHPAYHHVR